MKKIWSKVLIIGNCTVLIAGLVYGIISYFTYRTDDRYFFLKFCLLFGAVLVAFSLYCIVQMHRNNSEKECFSGEIVKIFTKYRFLLNQLVGKEFKLKYRRSYLGIAWSLINPLLMMIVISAVFSYMFRFNIEAFPAYLILGQTMFNFFSEATQLSLTSIVNSGQLIKKVYMPKYIFPLSRVISSCVNFLITLIPVMLVLLYYGITPTVYMLYLPLFIVYYFIFTFGVSLILATADVFMRDVQHFYSVLLTALSYATPIFYPVDSLSGTMKILMNLNPLYHFIKYFRNIMFYRVCPTVEENIVCLGLAFVALVLGVHIFFKKQNKFILYI